MNIGAFNLGNAIGAALGGGVIAAGLSLPFVSIAGAAASGMGLFAILISSRNASIRDAHLQRHVEKRTA
jgi:DHA1 family inner membrane transport protein